MTAKYSASFKAQAVKKALLRGDNVSQSEVAASLGIAESTLSKWTAMSRDNALELKQDGHSTDGAACHEKRPQDWTLEERLNMVLSCHSLSEEATSERCRSEGIYSHHIAQWKQDFMKTNQNTPQNKSSELKALKSENKLLKKELNRKEKALAETAALLVLQKKVHAIWGNDEDSLR